MYEQDFTIIKGETFFKEISVTVNNEVYPLIGYTAISEIRPYAGSPNLTDSFTCEIIEDKGLIQISLTNEQTNNLPKGTQFYDVLLINQYTNEYTYYMGGKLIIKNHVTELPT